MIKDNNIALFIDVDNCNLEFTHFDNAVALCKEYGNLIYGKAYGLSDRKHKDIIESAQKYGFDTTPAMRVKKRGSRVFDNRIIVDVIDAVLSYGRIDAVCIIAAPYDMVYLYSKLRTYGVTVMALNNTDDESIALIDEVVDIGYVEPLKPVAKRKNPFAKPPKAEGLTTTAKQEPQAPVVDEIQPVQQEQPIEQEVVTEAPATVEPQPQEEVQETEPEQQEEPQNQPEDIEDSQPAQDNTQEPQSTADEEKSSVTVEDQAEPDPQVLVGGDTEEDASILNQIENVKKTQSVTTQDDEKLLAEIKRLLAEFDKDSQ